MSESGNEQHKTGNRRHLRQAVDITGTISANDGNYDIEMLDLSKSGAKLRLKDSSVSLSIGQQVNLELQWPLETSYNKLDVSAVVMRMEDNEVSVKFDHVPDTDTSD